MRIGNRSGFNSAVGRETVGVQALDAGKAKLRRKALVTLVGAIALVDCTRSAVHATTQSSTWVGSTDTLWTTPANWSPNNAYPNNGNGTPAISDFNVDIPAPAIPADFSPTVNSAITIDDLTVEANATVTLGSAGSLTVKGPAFTNDGSITGSGTLNVSGITITQGVNGIISSTSAVNLTNVTVDGGTVGGAVTMNAGTFSNVAIATGALVIVSPFSSPDTLMVSGPTLVNNGTIQVDETLSNAGIDFTSNTTVSGNGMIMLDDNGPNAVLTAAAGVTVTLGAEQTVNGQGEVDAAVVNNGTVNANSGGNILYLQDSAMTNNNMFEANSGGTLAITGITVTQGTLGQIAANGMGSDVQLTNATIVGGTIGGSANGLVTVAAGFPTNTPSTFNGVTVAQGATVELLSNATLNIVGTTLTNDGVIQVDTLSKAGELNFTSTGTLLLTGSGTVFLDDYSPNAKITAPAGSTLTNDTMETIDGVGEIDVPLINNGTVTGSASTHTLVLKNGVAGTGTIGASGGGTLMLATGTGGSTQGGISIATGGHLDIANNHLFIDYGAGADPFSTLVGYLNTGYNAGKWNGPGIVSSTAAVTSGYGVGAVDAGSIAGKALGLSSGTIELKYTLYGDINLAGVVNGNDFAILAGNFGKTVTGGWEQGDLNYDGTVNGIDFALLAANFGKSAAGGDVVLPASQWAALDSFAAANGLLTDVPEPTPALLAAPVVAFSIAGTRRRPRKRPVE
jgi:hypothetical protein